MQYLASELKRLLRALQRQLRVDLAVLVQAEDCCRLAVNWETLAEDPSDGLMVAGLL